MDEYYDGCEECICNKCAATCEYCYGDPADGCCKYDCPFDDGYDE